MYNAVERYFDDFLGHQKLTLVASGTGPAAQYIYDKTNGTPTVIGIASIGPGVLAMTLDATSEAQGAGVYHGDILSFKADDILEATFRLAMAANCTTAQSLVWGLTSARSSNPDTPTYNAQFKLAASTAVVLETDDNATDNDDKASGGQILSTTFRTFKISFRNGLSDIRFFGEGTNGKLARLAPKTTFAAPALTGCYLQPNVLLSKASGSTAPVAYLDYWEILYKRS